MRILNNKIFKLTLSILFYFSLLNVVNVLDMIDSDVAITIINISILLFVFLTLSNGIDFTGLGYILKISNVKKYYLKKDEEELFLKHYMETSFIPCPFIYGLKYIKITNFNILVRSYLTLPNYYLAIIPIKNIIKIKEIKFLYNILKITYYENNCKNNIYLFFPRTYNDIEIISTIKENIERKEELKIIEKNEFKKLPFSVPESIIHIYNSFKIAGSLLFLSGFFSIILLIIISYSDNSEILTSFIVIFILFIITGIAFLKIADLILHKKRIGLILGIIGCFLLLIFIPIGTIFGIITLNKLLNKDVKDYFKKE